MSGALVVLGVDPAEVSRVLGVEPDRAWLVGERKRINLPEGQTKELPSVHEKSGWKKFSPKELSELGEAIDYWAAFVRARIDVFVRMPAAADVKIELLFQENQAFDLRAADLMIFATAHIGLGLTIQVLDD